MTEIQPGGHPAGVYRSYLVRFWQSNEQGRWRASAQCVQTGSTLRFGDVESLLAFLEAEVTDTLRQENVAISPVSSKPP